MRLRLLQLPKLVAERRSSAIFGIVIIAMLWAGIAIKYAGDVGEDKREAERTSRNFAAAFEENVLRSIGEIDKALLYLRRAVETRKSADYYAILQPTDVLSDIILQAAIVDDKGIIRWSNARSESSPVISVADREHIKVQLTSSQDNLFISKPLVGRASGQWSVQFTRRFMKDDGTIGGVVVASLNPAHFTAFYEKIDFGSSASISLIGSDGVVRASGGSAGGFALGQDLNGTVLFTNIRAGINVAFEDNDAATGTRHLVTIRKVNGHPLWVAVTVDTDDIYKGSSATVQLNVIAGVVLTLILLVALGWRRSTPSSPTTLHLLQLPRLIAKRRSSAIFGTVIIAMLWAGVILKYSGDVRNDRREAERTNRNFTMVFEENVLRSIGEIDKALLYMRRTIETRMSSTDLGTIVNTTDVLSETIVQVGIIDSKGIMRASNSGPQPPPALDLSDREHYKVHVDRKEDQLFISKPVIGRASGKWSVQLSRRFLNGDGSFAGVVVASLNPAHFTAFYDKIDFGSSASIIMIGSDGVVRSSGGAAGDFALGQDLKGTTLFAHMQTGSNATFEDNGADSNARRLVTSRKVKGHPLWVAVGVDMDDIYKSSWATLQLNVIAGIVLTLIVLVAMERILRTEATARQEAEQLQLTLENMSQGIMLVTKDLQIPIINRRCGELLNLPPDLIEHPPRFDQLGEFQAVIGGVTGSQAPIEHHEAKGSSGSFAISERRMPNGTVIEVRSGALPNGGLVQTFTDITKRCEAEARVARLASEDPLTGLPNRRVFRATLDQMSERQGPSAEGRQPEAEFAVLFLDIDRFKVVNDTLGHRIGDLLLQEAAKRLKEVLPATDILARLGGDEFAVVVSAFESRAALEALAGRLTEAIAQPYEIDGHRIRSSVSIGIAVGPPDGNNADDLLMAADLALYAVKAGARGSYRFYEKSMNEEINDRRQIEMDLREAIERHELELHYQPIIDLRRNVVTGFEALARWRHPIRGMVPPAVFIPVAEDSGLILELGAWALAEACRRAAQWPEHLKVAVNLSPVQFSTPNLCQTIASILAETELKPQRLELEITERLFMEDSAKTLSILHGLKQLGIRISMDDFGTGYSSLSYLRSFPFDKIKVDRTFVSDLASGTEHVVIVQAVVSIARALGMTTTAEGVETAGQKEFLTALGCDEAQGYLFSAPVPIEKVPEIIAELAAERTLAA